MKIIKILDNLALVKTSCKYSTLNRTILKRLSAWSFWSWASRRLFVIRNRIVYATL